jgi:hypothetical protein
VLLAGQLQALATHVQCLPTIKLAHPAPDEYVQGMPSPWTLLQQQPHV